MTNLDSTLMSLGLLTLVGVTVVIYMRKRELYNRKHGFTPIVSRELHNPWRDYWHNHGFTPRLNPMEEEETSIEINHYQQIYNIIKTLTIYSGKMVGRSLWNQLPSISSFQLGELSKTLLLQHKEDFLDSEESEIIDKKLSVLREIQDNQRREQEELEKERERLRVEQEELKKDQKDKSSKKREQRVEIERQKIEERLRILNIEEEREKRIQEQQMRLQKRQQEQQRKQQRQRRLQEQQRKLDEQRRLDEQERQQQQRVQDEQERQKRIQKKKQEKEQKKIQDEQRQREQQEEQKRKREEEQKRRQEEQQQREQQRQQEQDYQRELDDQTRLDGQRLSYQKLIAESLTLELDRLLLMREYNYIMTIEEIALLERLEGYLQDYMKTHKEFPDSDELERYVQSREEELSQLGLGFTYLYPLDYLIHNIVEKSEEYKRELHWRLGLGRRVDRTDAVDKMSTSKKWKYTPPRDYK